MTLIRNFTIIYLTYSPPIPKFPSIIHSTFSLHNRLPYKTAHKTQNFPTEKRERSPVPLIHLSFIHFPNIPSYFSTIPCTASTRSTMSDLVTSDTGAPSTTARQLLPSYRYRLISTVGSPSRSKWSVRPISSLSPGCSAASASLRNSPAESPYPQELPHNPSGFSAAAPAYSDHTGTCSCNGHSGGSP